MSVAMPLSPPNVLRGARGCSLFRQQPRSKETSNKVNMLSYPLWHGFKKTTKRQIADWAVEQFEQDLGHK